MDKLVEKILLTATEMLQSERCGVYVLQEERKRPFDIGRSPSLPRTFKPISAEFMRAYELDIRAESTQIEVLPIDTFQNSLRAAIARYVLAKNETVTLTAADIKAEFNRSCDYDGIDIQVHK